MRGKYSFREDTMKKRLISLLLVVSMLAVMLVAANVAFADQGVPITSGWTSVPPTLDSTISPGEWDNAYALTFASGIVYVMNDDTNLYIAAVIPDGTPSISDFLSILFDDSHDAALTDGDEDAKSAIYLDGVTDWHWHDLPVSWQVDITNDLLAGSGYAYAAGQYTIEMGMPLNSGDTEDLSASAGDTVGLELVYSDNGSWTVWPAGARPGGAADPEVVPTTWGNLILASEPTGPAKGVAIFPSVYALIGAVLAAGGLGYLIRRRLVRQA